MKIFNNMLSSIINASNLRKKRIDIKVNKLCIKILKKLRKLNYIDFFKIYHLKNQPMACVNLRYIKSISVISKIKVLSISSNVKHYRYKDICGINNIYPFLGILLTSRGILTHIECLKKKTGGIFLFLIL